jgi:hypothetical protein
MTSPEAPCEVPDLRRLPVLFEEVPSPCQRVRVGRNGVSTAS